MHIHPKFTYNLGSSRAALALRARTPDLIHLPYFVKHPFLPKALQSYLGSVHGFLCTTHPPPGPVYAPREAQAFYRSLLPLHSLLQPSGHTLVIILSTVI